MKFLSSKIQFQILLLEYAKYCENIYYIPDSSSSSLSLSACSAILFCR